jgi:hypothetical protein
MGEYSAPRTWVASRVTNCNVPVQTTPLRCGTGIAQHLRREALMPEKETIERAQKDAREGKAPSTQAGEFVREEIEHIREGKHGARSTKQAIAIGLSKARRAGVKLPPPDKGKVSEETRTHAARDYAKGQRTTAQTRGPRLCQGTEDDRSDTIPKEIASRPHSTPARRQGGSIPHSSCPAGE